MLSLSLLTENKIASVGAGAIVTGFIILLSASTIDTGPMENEDGGDVQLANISKKKTLMALGGSVMSMGVLAQVYDQYTRRFKSSGRSSSQMSPAELSRFQDRVSEAAAKLRKSIAETTGESQNSSPLMDGGQKESAAELAARASAQISSFIQTYS